MAVAYESIETAGVASGNVVITKPTGLAAGNLMLAVLNSEDSGSDFSAAGWTKIASLADSTARAATALFKVADASDAAASNFTFTNPGNEAFGALMRISGTGFTDIDNIKFSAVRSASTDETPTFSPGITTVRDNDLLVLAVVAPEILTTFSTYAVANSNPSWTERADFQNNQTEDASMAIATATYATAGATGDFSAAFTSASQSFGFLFGITEDIGANLAPGVLTISVNLIEPVLAGTANISVDAPLGVVASVVDATVTTSSSPTTNTTKNAGANVVNTSKS